MSSFIVQGCDLVDPFHFALCYLSNAERVLQNTHTLLLTSALDRDASYKRSASKYFCLRHQLCRELANEQSWLYFNKYDFVLAGRILQATACCPCPGCSCKPGPLHLSVGCHPRLHCASYLSA